LGVDFRYLKKFKYKYPNRKLYSLIDKVYDLRTLKEAWERIEKNQGCAGIDGVTIQQFKSNLKRHLREIHRELKTGRYTPPPVLRKYIPKKDGKLRPLGIPTIKDRIVQQAVKMVLEPIFEVKFLDCSYGYRPNRSAQQAMKKLEYYRTGKAYRWTLDGDIKGFFDNVDHDIMIGLVAKEISDGQVLDLITKWLKAGVITEGKQEESKIGTPQGGVISPLLANIYLHEFDVYMIERKHNLIRYADDFVVVCTYKGRAQKALEDAKEMLSKLKLQLHPEKTRIVHSEEMQFLGFRIGGKGNGGMKPTQEAVTKLKQKVKEATARNRTTPVDEIVRKTNAAIIGWGHYYKIGTVGRLYPKLDQYIRTRLRIYIEKKVSRHSHQRLSNYTLGVKYGLKSLGHLFKQYQQNSQSV